MRELLFVLLKDTREVSQEILDDIDWCLERLENIQTHRSIADMASTKVRNLKLFSTVVYISIHDINNCFIDRCAPVFRVERGARWS